MDSPKDRGTCQVLASLLTEEQIQLGRVYPPLTQIGEISIRIATEIGKYAYKVT